MTLKLMVSVNAYTLATQLHARTDNTILETTHDTYVGGDPCLSENGPWCFSYIGVIYMLDIAKCARQISLCGYVYVCVWPS